MRVDMNKTSREMLTGSKRQTDARSLDRNLENSFSAILESVGRSGYESAEPVQGNQKLEDVAVGKWENWFEFVGQQRYSAISKFSDSSDQMLPLSDVRQGFGKIVRDAYANNGYVNSKQHVEGLSKDELRILQQIHGLADPIQADGLSEEGALNLLIAPSAGVDLNRDGITTVGRANKLEFPDSTTPPDVREAWEAVTANLSPADLGDRVLMIKGELTLNNTYANPDGTFAYRVEPGDPRWVNTFATEGSFKRFAQGQLATTERFRYQMPPSQYERDKAFWSDFLSLLGNNSKSDVSI